MVKIIGALADRMLRVVVPDVTAGACPCMGGDRDVICNYGRLLFCQYNCYCDPINCEYLGTC